MLTLIRLLHTFCSFVFKSKTTGSAAGVYLTLALKVQGRGHGIFKKISRGEGGYPGVSLSSNLVSGI